MSDQITCAEPFRILLLLLFIAATFYLFIYLPTYLLIYLSQHL